MAAETMTIPLHWLTAAAGMVFGALATGVWSHWREVRNQRRWKEAWEKTRERLAALEREKGELTSRLEAAALYREHNDTLRRELEEARAKTADLMRLNGELEARLQERSFATETMLERFEAIGLKIMEQNGEKFGNLSQRRVEAALRPLKEMVESFGERIERMNDSKSRQIAALSGEIKALMALNRQIGEEAQALSRALKGDTKRQGIWGEMVLERVLEASGLREGEEYVREPTFAIGGRRLRPDAMVRLPRDRTAIIDAKTSLRAYERYVNAENEEARRRYAKEHLRAVREHIKTLGMKRYDRIPQLRSLDFVFMFVPIEGALALALRSDPTLYEEAFAKGVVLTGPSTLLVALRAIESAWRSERQERNARLIAQKGGELYDALAAFVEEMQKLGRQLDGAQKSYESAWRKLSAGRAGLVRKAEELKELGATGTRNAMPGEDHPETARASST